VAALEEKLAEAVRQFPGLYEKSCRDFRDSKKKLAWEDVAKQEGLQTDMYCSGEYSFICLMFSLVRIMLLYEYSFLGSFCLVISNNKSSKISHHLPGPPSWTFTTESEAYDSASVVPIHTRTEQSSDSDSAYDFASVASVASVNQL